jgi:hypothetical protein
MSFLKNAMNNDKGFFQGGKSFGGKGIDGMLSELIPSQPIIDNSPEGVIDNSESGNIYTSQILPALRAQRIAQAQQAGNLQIAPQNKYAAMNAALRGGQL